MEPTAIVFYLFASLAVVSGVMVVTRRNAVHAAMFLVLTFFSVAAIYVTLSAEFLAAVQILVYAGGIMVLFLFVIMLLDLKEEERRRIRLTGLVAGVISVGTILAIFVTSLCHSSVSGPKSATLEGQTPELGRLLFESYLLPLEIVGVLLLVAMVGVVLLSKKDLK